MLEIAMVFRKFRTSHEIFAAILRSSLSDTDGTRITKLMFDSLLNYKQLTDNLKELMDCGLIANEPEITRYKITEKGARFLKLMDGMDGLLRI
jgi:predicted transcriptional regulator